jgi:hypothetical protein
MFAESRGDTGEITCFSPCYLKKASGYRTVFPKVGGSS